MRKLFIGLGVISCLLSLKTVATVHDVCSAKVFETDRFEALRSIVEDVADANDTVLICDAYIPMRKRITVGKSGLTIRGNNSRLIATTDFADAAMFFVTNNKVTIENIQLNGNNKAHTGIRVYKDRKNITIQNNLITRFKGVGRPYSTSTPPARGIYLQTGTKEVAIMDNTLTYFGGSETLADSNWEAKGPLAHRAIYAVNPSKLKITKNNIEYVYGHLDGDAIHIYDNSCQEIAGENDFNLIAENTIKEFGKRAIKLHGGNVKVTGNTILSSGTKVTGVAANEIGMPLAGIATLRGPGCTATNQPKAIVQSNIIKLERATGGLVIQAEGEYSNNTVTVNSSASGRHNVPSAAVKVAEVYPKLPKLGNVSVTGNSLSHPMRSFCYAATTHTCNASHPANIVFTP